MNASPNREVQQAAIALIITAASPTRADDEVFADPDYSGGVSASWNPDEEGEDTYDPLANTGVAKLEMSGQQGVDIHRENYLEDFFESRLRFGAETDLRMSRKLRLSTGARLDFFFASPHPHDADLTAYGALARDYARYEFDVVPLSAYVDATAVEGVHVRVGVQPISMGRMDFFSPTDMLLVWDTRPAPRSDPASQKLAQMALKIDWDMTSWATLQLAYIPWFMPHASRPSRDRFVGAAAIGVSAARTEISGGGLVSPSQEPQVAPSTLRYLGPAPDFTYPQAEARLTMRGSTFELAVLAGTAIEKLPFVYYGPELVRYLALSPSAKDWLGAAADVGSVLADGKPPVSVAYPRYSLLGLDGSVDIAPISVGFEAAFSPSRVLYAASREGDHPPLPNVSHEVVGASSMEFSSRVRSIRKGVPVVQGALHVDWIDGEKLALVAEAFVIQALELPYDRSRDWLGFIRHTATFAGGIVAASYRMLAGKLNVMATVAMLPGLSVIAMPMAELKLSDSLYANLGLQIYEGPAPGNIPLATPSAPPFPAHLTAGGVFSGFDQVTLGFRWLPGN